MTFLCPPRPSPGGGELLLGVLGGQPRGADGHFVSPGDQSARRRHGAIDMHVYYYYAEVGIVCILVGSSG